MKINNNKRLFYGSCFAIITTAFSFSIRAGILPELAETFNLTAQQLGFINQMWFVGFPITMVIGGIFYHSIGPKNIMIFAFLTHSAGIILTIYSGGYNGLLISTLLIGLGNGCTEAACNPMIADSYKGKTMNTLMNRFHMWFTGGIVLGSLISYLMSKLNLGWELQIYIFFIPTLAYAFLFYGQKFPKPQLEATTVYGNLKAMGSPVFIFIALCMALTAISEFGPTQWAQLVLEKSGAVPMFVLALIMGIMTIGRYFGGEIVHKLDQTGVLLASSIFTAVGTFMLSTTTGPLTYVSAGVFAVGVCYFWPNMIGFVAEKIPKSGALGMSIVGAIGMFSTSIFQPVIGSWIDEARQSASRMGITGDELELLVGQETLSRMTLFPVILIFLFTGLYFWMKKMKNEK